MPRYNLTIEPTKGQYREIIWKEDKDAYLLNKIDSFTQHFDEEEALKEFLIKQGLIYPFDYEKEITIRYKNNHQIKKVKNGLSFKDSIPYFNYDTLRHILTSKLDDLTFLNKLCHEYYTSIEPELNAHVYRCKNNIYCDREEYEDMYNILDKFILNHTLDNKSKINYKKYRDLAMFVYMNDKLIREKEKPKTRTKLKEPNQPSLFPELD